MKNWAQPSEYWENSKKNIIFALTVLDEENNQKCWSDVKPF
jgi:hypothetical protein